MKEVIKKAANGHVTFAMLASVLVAAAGLGRYLLDTRDRAVHEIIQAHVDSEDSRMHIFEQSLIRMETKQDRIIDRLGIGWPPSAPPLSSIPVADRPDAMHFGPDAGTLVESGSADR